MTLTLKWNGAGLYLPVGGESDLDREAREGWIDDLYLDLLARFAGQGRNVSHKNTAPANYGPRLFAQEAEGVAAQVTREDFEAAQRRLFKADRIHVQAYGRKGQERVAKGRKILS